MYLTRMHLNPHRRGTRFLLASPQRMHAAVLGSFPPGAATESADGRILWRLDEGEHALTLYVSSPSRPDLSAVLEKAGWPLSEQAWQTAPLAGVTGRLESGQVWRFRLTANPVNNIAAGPGVRGRRRAHVTVAQQEQWLLDRAGRHGFEIVEQAGGPAITVAARRTLSFERRTDGARRTVTVGVASFDGLLEVTEPDLVRRALGHGLGRAKAYGCGLMTLAPAP